jgi:putative DNA primase/helicase
VEGEKDADTVTNLQLGRWPKLVVGVTSGGSGSWKPEFANHLIGKQVILVPDNDEAGERYAHAVEASLIAENIEYRRISFRGTGCKDISEYMAEHTVAELVELVGKESLPLLLNIPTDPRLDEEILV